MLTFFKGTAFGAAIAISCLFGFAYADQKAERPCRVDVGFARTTPSSQCGSDEVMVGYRDDYILCADVRVSCGD